VCLRRICAIHSVCLDAADVCPFSIVWLDCLQKQLCDTISFSKTIYIVLLNARVNAGPVRCYQCLKLYPLSERIRSLNRESVTQNSEIYGSACVLIRLSQLSSQ